MAITGNTWIVGLSAAINPMLKDVTVNVRLRSAPTVGMRLRVPGPDGSVEVTLLSVRRVTSDKLDAVAQADGLPAPKAPPRRPSSPPPRPSSTLRGGLFSDDAVIDTFFGRR